MRILNSIGPDALWKCLLHQKRNPRSQFRTQSDIQIGELWVELGQHFVWQIRSKAGRADFDHWMSPDSQSVLKYAPLRPGAPHRGTTCALRGSKPFLDLSRPAHLVPHNVNFTPPRCVLRSFHFPHSARGARMQVTRISKIPPPT
jgi:hypothetical protein